MKCKWASGTLCRYRGHQNVYSLVPTKNVSPKCQNYDINRLIYDLSKLTFTNDLRKLFWQQSLKLFKSGFCIFKTVWYVFYEKSQQTLFGIQNANVRFCSMVAAFVIKLFLSVQFVQSMEIFWKFKKFRWWAEYFEFHHWMLSFFKKN